MKKGIVFASLFLPILLIIDILILQEDFSLRLIIKVLISAIISGLMFGLITKLGNKKTTK